MTSPTIPLPAFARTTIRAVTDAPGYDHLVSLPPGYKVQSGQAWPLLLFLHGAAERGQDVWGITRQGLPRLLAFGDDLAPAERPVAQHVRETCIVVAPQCSHYEVWNEDQLLALLDAVVNGYEVDQRRVYLTGLSLGGFGTWAVGLRHPDRFAAIAPVCGGGRIADVLLATDRYGDALHSLGVWAFHGAKDRVVPLEESERMIRALQTARVTDLKLTVYPDAEHDSWTPTYANPELYAWLLRHAR